MLELLHEYCPDQKGVQNTLLECKPGEGFRKYQDNNKVRILVCSFCIPTDQIVF